MFTFWAKLFDMRLSQLGCDWLTAGTCSFFELFDKGFSLFDNIGGWSDYGDAVSIDAVIQT
jgi:hypothetical protein